MQVTIPTSRLQLRRSSEHGGVMIMALLITCAATVGFVAWGNLIAQRSQNVEQAMGGAQRRLAVENGRQFAREYACRNFLTKASGTAGAISQNETNNQVIGGISVPSWSGYALDSVEYPIGYNQISPAATGIGFGPTLTCTVPFSVTDYYPDPTVRDSTSTSLLAVAKSRSPLTSGDLLVIHAPSRAIAAPTITGSFDVFGAASFLVTSSPSNYNSVRAEAFNTPAYVPGTTANPNLISIKNPTTNGTVVASNFPSMLTTTGSADSDGNAVDTLNRLNVVAPGSNPGNSLRSKLQTTGSYGFLNFNTTADHPDTGNGISFVASTGVLTMDLSTETMPWVVLDNNVTQINLIGASSSSMQAAVPAAICYVEDAATTVKKLTTISCSGSANQRRIILGIKKVSALATDAQEPVTLSFTSAVPLWRAMLITENTPLIFTSGGGGAITLQGGIQTDSPLTSSSTTTGSGVKLISEPASFQSWPNKLLPRRGWIETYFDFTNGNL